MGHKQCSWALINLVSPLDSATDYNPVFCFTILNFTLCPVPSLTVIFLSGTTGSFTYLQVLVYIAIVSGYFSSELTPLHSATAFTMYFDENITTDVYVVLHLILNRADICIPASTCQLCSIMMFSMINPLSWASTGSLAPGKPSC